MATFSGRYYNSVDSKGRVMVPAMFRETITSNYGPQLYVTYAAFDSCLLIYPAEEWAGLQERISALPQMDDAVTYFKRRVVGSAHMVEMDKQGRVLLPHALREDTGINGEAVVVGMINTIEVWDKDKWDEVTNPEKVDAEAFKKTLSGLGL